MNVSLRWALLAFLTLAATVAPAQVTLVADIAPGAASSYLSGLTRYHDALYFTAEASVDERGLWRYDTASDVAELVVALGPDELGPTQLTVHDDRLYFTADELREDGVFTRIWSFDSETDSAMPITDALWPYTRLVVYDGRLFFTYADSTGYALWAYDDASGTTAPVTSSPSFALAAEFTVYDDRLFFRAPAEPFNGEYDLWFYEAATGEVIRTDAINPGGNSYPSGLTVYAGHLFFSASNEEVLEELWQYDAATETATLAADISPVTNPNGSSPRDLTLYDGRLFFSVLGENFDRELWAYDAAMEEASFVADVSPGMGELGGMTVFDGRLFFAGYAGSELWAYDAATGTTAVLAQDVRPCDLTVYDGRLFFSGFETDHGTELWVYDAIATDVEPASTPGSAVLSAAYPNPTRGAATITLTLTEPQHVRLTVHDALGREVTMLHDGVLPVAEHVFRLDGTALPSGLYVLRAVGEHTTMTQRVTVVR